MIDKPIEGVRTVTRPHPPGAKGAMLSLQEVADRAWAARMSPRIRAWATQAMHNAGVSTGGRRERAQAILEAFRKKVPYVADPVMGEFMAKPEQTLCLDEGGLCLIGGDCDDMSIALAAIMMNIGIPAMIVGASHRNPPETPTHVYMAFEDDRGEWVRMDGTTQLPVGKAPHALREWWVKPGSKAEESGHGDFVGMAGHETSGRPLSGHQSAGLRQYPGLESGDVGLSGPPMMSDLKYPGIR